MKRIINILWVAWIVIGLSFTPSSVLADGLDQTDTPRGQAEALIKTLTPEEKVGQLFIVTYKGTDISEKSQIYDLITNRHIGGIVLLAANDNFTYAYQTVPNIYRTISQLQTNVWWNSQKFIPDTVTEKPFKPAYIPLLMGINQEGDGFPNDQIRNGLTMLPDAMAIGATWKPELATKIGAVLGSELQSIGINLLLGPSLDVLEKSTQGFNDLGTRTFGGDPYWVGEMGKAYITGIHQGSNNRIAVIAKHFPGRGGSDRPLEEEVATVRKSLEQLKQIELAPFFAVTDNAKTPEAATDGLLVSHIRYQGFQGNIRATTRPISFDKAALAQLMSLKNPGFTSWRENGGLLVSDDLGSRAVRRFQDPTEKTFDARQVILNAFLAGNDLLFADNITATGESDSYTTIIHTLEFFAQKYREDSAFAQTVDASLTRILTLKYHLYGTFNLKNVLPIESSLALVGKANTTVFEVAQQAVTMISPAQAELDSVLPKPPGIRERIVFLTDVQIARQCSKCQDQPTFALDALQNAVIRLYGPQVGGQVLLDRLTSFSFTNVINLLNKDEKSPPPVALEVELKRADWVVFAFLDIKADRPESMALKRILSERPDLLNNKKVIAFAFNGPYFLDATDISKLTAYYGLYSKAPAFIDVAARVLFQEISPTGALPVSVPGVGYEMIVATAPNPNQVIPLFIDTPGKPPTQGTATVSPTPVLKYKVGDTIPLRTGVIVDMNRHPVPDKTIARFSFRYGGDPGVTQQIEAETSQGIAQTSFRVDKPGMLEIRVASDPATNSEVIQLNIAGIEGVTASVIPSTVTITVTPSPSSTLTPTPTQTITTTTIPPATLAPTPLLPRDGYPDPLEWLYSIVIISLGAGAAYLLGYWWWGSVQWALRWGLCAILGGITAYMYLLAGLPAGVNWVQQYGAGGIILVTTMGIMAGWAAAVLWRMGAGNGKNHVKLR